MAQLTWRRTSARSSGFSLVELIVVVAIIGVGLSIAVIGWGQMWDGLQVRDAADKLQLSLLYSRGEAIRRGTRVTLTPVSGSNWSSGWTATISGPTTLRSWDSFGTHVSLACSGGCPATLVYDVSGRLVGTTDPNSFVLTASDTSVVKCVQIRLSGLPSVENASSC